MIDKMTAMSSIVAMAWFFVVTCSIGVTQTMALSENTTGRNLQMKTKQTSKKTANDSKGTIREQKRWYDIRHETNNAEKGWDLHYGKSSSKGKGGMGESKDSGKGKGKGMMRMGMRMKGKDNGSNFPRFCKYLDFDNQVPYNDYSSGKGKNVGKGKGKGREFESFCTPNVFDVTNLISDISIFVSLIEQAGLEDIFVCPGPYTILAPSNSAFVNNPTITAYLRDVTNEDELRRVLLYHILPGLTLVDDFETGPIETLLMGSEIDVTIDPIVLFNDAAFIEENDIVACNGIINIINNILLPPGKFSMNILPIVVNHCCDVVSFNIFILFLPHFHRRCNYYTGNMPITRFF
jgi:hypothetical protein